MLSPFVLHFPRCTIVPWLKDFLSVLAKFHREVFVPDFERILDAHFNVGLTPFRGEMLSHFDAIYKRFDRLESQCQELNCAVHRIEQIRTVIERKLDLMP